MKTRAKSISLEVPDTTTNIKSIKNTKNKPKPPCSLRRLSFLSRTMIDNESFSIYDSYAFSRGPSSYHVISLKESQGFLFNQDLFASSYQQLRTLMREKQEQLLSSRKRSKSHGTIRRWQEPLAEKKQPKRQPRRHTSFGNAPMLRIIGDDSAVTELSSDDDMCIDDFSNGHEDVPDQPPSRLAKAMSFSEHLHQRGFHNTQEMDHNMELEEDEGNDMESDFSDDFGHAHDRLNFAPIGSNYVPVIDILVDDMDHIPDL